MCCPPKKVCIVTMNDFKLFATGQINKICYSMSIVEPLYFVKFEKGCRYGSVLSFVVNERQNVVLSFGLRKPLHTPYVWIFTTLFHKKIARKGAKINIYALCTLETNWNYDLGF